MRNLIVVLAFVLFSAGAFSVFAQIPNDDPIMIHVDRSVKPKYPDNVEKLVYPELEFTGPTDYDLSKVLQLVLEEQRRYPVSGNEIYKYLRDSGNISRCLSLQDGEKIKAGGPAVFSKAFGHQKVFLWKSIARLKRGQLAVPFMFLFESDDNNKDKDKVYFNWWSLQSGWDTYNPALMFPQ